jgi:hypothetical protein
VDFAAGGGQYDEEEECQRHNDRLFSSTQPNPTQPNTPIQPYPTKINSAQGYSIPTLISPEFW